MKVLSIVYLLIAFVVFANAQQNTNSISNSDSDTASNLSQNSNNTVSNSNASVNSNLGANTINESNSSSITTLPVDKSSSKNSNSSSSNDNKQSDENFWVKTILSVVTIFSLGFGFYTSYRSTEINEQLKRLTQRQADTGEAMNRLVETHNQAIKNLTERQVIAVEEMNKFEKSHNQAIKDLTQKQLDLATENTGLVKANQKIIENQDKSRFYDEFKDFHAEFWNTPTIAEVRRWIANSEAYEKIKPTIAKRLKGEVSSSEYETLEKIDQFCALMTRLSRIRLTAMDESQKTLWTQIYYENWLDKCFERKELAAYMNEHWKRLVESARDAKINQINDENLLIDELA